MRLDGRVSPSRTGPTAGVLATVVEALGRAGARLTVVLPDGRMVATAAEPSRARVVLRDEAGASRRPRGEQRPPGC